MCRGVCCGPFKLRRDVFAVELPMLTFLDVWTDISYLVYQAVVGDFLDRNVSHHIFASV